MTPAEEVVTLPGWRWMPGMLVTSAGNTYRVMAQDIDDGMGSPEYQREWIRPHLDDPATLGCLLALVREAVAQRRPRAMSAGIGCAGDRSWVVSVGERIERVYPTCTTSSVEYSVIGQGPTEAAALVAALRGAT